LLLFIEQRYYDLFKDGISRQFVTKLVENIFLSIMSDTSLAVSSLQQKMYRSKHLMI